MQGQRITLIAALGRGRVIGKGNRLLWRIPADLRRFRALTLGHPVIMGRKTFESIGAPLPGRTNIVITRQSAWKHPGTLGASSLEHALVQAGSGEVYVAGGGEIYALALPLATRLCLTLVDDAPDGDVFFPSYEHLFPHPPSTERMEWNGVHYRWVDLER